MEYTNRIQVVGESGSGGENAQNARREVARLRCIICDCMRNQPIFNEDGIDILRCVNCDHVYSSFEADPHYDGFWGDEVAEGDHSYWNKARARMHQDFIRRFLVGHSGRLLDMGCGLGFFLKAIAPYPNWETYGCEISPAAVRYARESLGLQNVICGRLEDTDLPQRSFDLITMWDVIDHIPRPDPLLRCCHSLLKESGICFMRTPNVYIQLLRARLAKLLRGTQPTVAYMQARHHAHHYSRSSIRRILERNGFSRIRFVHLHPIQSEVGGKNGFVQGVKNACFEVVRALSIVSRGHLNLDNLFVIAHKES